MLFATSLRRWAKRSYGEKLKAATERETSLAPLNGSSDISDSASSSNREVTSVQAVG
jgi:hypothetical protein